MFKQVRLDHGGMAALLTGPEVAGAIADAAHAVQAAVPEVRTRSGAAHTDVNLGTTDRAKAYVTLVHPVAIGLEARYGYLVRAAASVGLDYKSYGAG